MRRHSFVRQCVHHSMVTLLGTNSMLFDLFLEALIFLGIVNCQHHERVQGLDILVLEQEDEHLEFKRIGYVNVINFECHSNELPWKCHGQTLSKCLKLTFGHLASLGSGRSCLLEQFMNFS